jgi:hypothetical protein
MGRVVKFNDMKQYSFFFHYNKPQSTKVGKPQISIHYRKTCYIVDNIVCNVPTWGYIKKDQPRFVIKGKGTISFTNNIATII